MNARLVSRRLKLLGTGASLPGAPISTEALLEKVEKNFRVDILRRGNFLNRRMGIGSRHHCRDFRNALETPREGDSNPELAARAVSQALEASGLSRKELGFLIGHTTSPHTLLPPNAAWVADRLAYGGPFTELRQACTGFAAALQFAQGLLSEPDAAPVAIVGSETGSVYLDPRAIPEHPDQLVNLLQMGDGAGAVVLGPDDGYGGPSIDLLFFGSLGLGKNPGFSLRNGGSAQPGMNADSEVLMFDHDFTGVRLNGLELFKAGLDVVRSAGVDTTSMRWIIPHQVNGRIGVHLAREVGIDEGRFFVQAGRLGNLGSAAIWVALHQLRASGCLEEGDRVLVLGAEATKYQYGGFVYTHREEAARFQCPRMVPRNRAASPSSGPSGHLLPKGEGI